MADAAQVYGTSFYEGQQTGSQSSAALVVPVINRVVQPKSVIDVGCGVGAWVSQFRKSGVEVAHGIDGPWVRDALVIDDGDFVEFDFSKADTPFRPATPLPRYDLATTFEVAEHIPDSQADDMVQLLCGLADVVVFGAAVPHQGGTHHVNEQWPDYWAAKFKTRDYHACDFIRPAFWAADAVESWYSQNTVAYFKGGVPDAAQRAADEAWVAFGREPKRLIHPNLWTGTHNHPGLRQALNTVKAAVRERLSKR